MQPFTHGKIQRFLIDKVQAPIVALGELIADQYPEPTKENTVKANSHRLIEIRDWFFQHQENDMRAKTIRGIFNYFISKYDFDNYYADRIDKIFEKLGVTNWEYRAGIRPDDYWTHDGGVKVAGSEHV